MCSIPQDYVVVPVTACLFIYLLLHSLDPLHGRDQLDVETVNVTKNLTKI